MIFQGGTLPTPQPGASDLFSELQGSSDVKVRELEAANDGLLEEMKSKEKVFIEFVTALGDSLNIHRPTSEFSVGILIEKQKKTFQMNSTTCMLDSRKM